MIRPFPRGLGFVGVMLELRVRAGEEQRLVTVFGPLDEVWRRAAWTSHLQDLTVSHGLPQGCGGNQDPVAN